MHVKIFHQPGMFFPRNAMICTFAPLCADAAQQRANGQLRMQIDNLGSYRSDT